jgi:hypothetical protein
MSKNFPALTQKNNENVNQDTQLTGLESKPGFSEHDIEL